VGQRTRLDVPVSGYFRPLMRDYLHALRTHGNCRDHWPDLNHVMLALLVDDHDGSPGPMQPFSGAGRAVRAWGRVVRAPVQLGSTTDGPTNVVAARTLDSAENLQTLAPTH
jgi:hypothetical protein